MVYFILAMLGERYKWNRVLSAPFHEYGTGFRHVIPAKAGVQKPWIPASAGMTMKDSGKWFILHRACEKVY
jgi:hypothetical protein